MALAICNTRLSMWVLRTVFLAELWELHSHCHTSTCVSLLLKRGLTQWILIKSSNGTDKPTALLFNRRQPPVGRAARGQFSFAKCPLFEGLSNPRLISRQTTMWKETRDLEIIHPQQRPAEKAQQVHWLPGHRFSHLGEMDYNFVSLIKNAVCIRTCTSCALLRRSVSRSSLICKAVSRMHSP